MPPPKQLTQAQAARCAGVSRTQIARLVREGKVSVEKDEDGTVTIEPSELLRVYPKADLEKARAARDKADRLPNGDDSSRSQVSPLQALVDVLAQDKERLQRELEQARAEAKEERDRLLHIVEEQSGQIRQLTDQRQRQEKERQPWWWRWR